MDNIEVIVGRVTSIVFEGNGGFVIAKVKLDDEYFEVTVKGVMQISVNQVYEFTGTYHEDPTYGENFKVISTKRPEIKGGDDIVSYLSSAQFEGIGKRTALKIYKAFGDETLDIIKTNPKMLLDIGIHESVVEELSSKTTTDTLMEDLYKLLTKYQFSEYLIKAIYGYLVENATGNKYKLFVDNPYMFISKIKGLTFNKVDEIYIDMGGQVDDLDRLKFLLSDIISRHCYQTGDTYLNQEIAKERLKLATTFDYEFELVLNQAIADKIIMQVDDALSVGEFYNSEYGIARNIGYRLNTINRGFKKGDIQKQIKKLEEKFGITYSVVQKDAITNALLNNLFIITGGPGTGKTTIIKAIVTIYHELLYQDSDIKNISDKIMLCAPTGRAAQRMKQATGYDAKTIHSLLGWDAYQDTFLYNLENPLNQEIFVIDEFSMVDVFLAYSLLKAIKPTAIILIVGDGAQLESVNPGNVLSDLLESEVIAHTYLDVIYRQGDGSTIAALAKHIDLNEKIELVNTHDMSILQRDGSLVDLVNVIYQKSLEANYDQMDIQVLYPKYKGVNGIDNLNLTLKPKLDPKLDHVIYNEITYQVGDRIMQLKNDPGRDIYNGDLGIIKAIIDPEARGNDDYILISIRNKDVVVSKNQMIEITHSYAISVHKSQGSEFKVIILPITRDSKNMLSKKLIYTAVTRSKEKLVIIGDMAMFDLGINEHDYKRKTNLVKFLQLHTTKEKSPIDFL